MQQHLRELIPAGDLIGSGIHEVIQARGSVVDRLPTEEQLGLAPESTSEAELKFAPETSTPILSGVDGSMSSQSQRARVAEQLLKSARLLEGLNGRADRQQKLIDQLRVEARNLLAE